MKTFDKNGDGEINKEEWKELITEFFKAMQQKTATLGGHTVSDTPVFGKMSSTQDIPKSHSSVVHFRMSHPVSPF